MPIAMPKIAAGSAKAATSIGAMVIGHLLVGPGGSDAFADLIGIGLEEVGKGVVGALAPGVIDAAFAIAQKGWRRGLRDDRYSDIVGRAIYAADLSAIEELLETYRKQARRMPEEFDSVLAEALFKNGKLWVRAERQRLLTADPALVDNWRRGAAAMSTISAITKADGDGYDVCVALVCRAAYERFKSAMQVLDLDAPESFQHMFLGLSDAAPSWWELTHFHFQQAYVEDEVLFRTWTADMAVEQRLNGAHLVRLASGLSATSTEMSATLSGALVNLLEVQTTLNRIEGKLARLEGLIEVITIVIASMRDRVLTEAGIESALAFDASYSQLRARLAQLDLPSKQGDGLPPADRLVRPYCHHTALTEIPCDQTTPETK